MSKYDFLLFENYHQAQNHKYDLMLIARMLAHHGLKVAILDVYGEDNVDSLQGIPVIHLPFSTKIPNDKWQLGPRNKVHSLLCKLRFLWQQHWYLKKVVNYIEPLANQFYCGSYHLLMSTQLMHMHKPTYFWGLRSSRMTGFGRKIVGETIEAVQMLRLKRCFLKNANCRLFVSNEIIREEFQNLGIEPSRMVIREERCVETIGNNPMELMDPNPSFLVIGQLRVQKNVTLTIEAFKKANIASSHLYLIGKSQGKYEKVIEPTIQGDARITRRNEYLDYNDFYDYFSKSHFVLFADDQGESCITNGTMMEALINHRPVICPDYNPFSYYVNKYGVGLLYKPGDLDSYTSALKQAAEQGPEKFINNIEQFLETISFERASKQLVQDINLSV